VTEASRPRLMLCTTCRAGKTLAENEPTPGALLHAAVQALVAAMPARVELMEVVCLANCERGCSAAIAMHGKWTYLLGRLEPALAEDLLTYVESYAASATGTVLPSRRPASLRNMIVGRVPCLECRE
jgi:predicted metal-binding protein